ncbi:MAG TPA: hypothetical protein VIM70_06240 [Clostridium sp.]
MHKTTNENTKSISEIFNFIDLIEGYLKDLENRVSVLEENQEYDGNYDR